MVTPRRTMKSAAKTPTQAQQEATETPERTPVRKKTASRAQRQQNIRFIESRQVDPMTLASYEKNPRRGNVQAVAESLMEHGQYRPILVRTHDGGAKVRVPTILAGNHTWKAIIYLHQIAIGQIEKPDWIVQAEKRIGRKVKPWPKIAIITVDATDEEAARMVLADNRTADLGGYDASSLHELIRSLPDPYGTGYTSDEYNAIVNAASKNAAETVKLLEDTVERIELIDDAQYEALDPLGDIVMEVVEQTIDTDAEDDVPAPLLDEAEELKNPITKLADDPVFQGVGYMEIPPLRPDMLIEDLPELTTWSGSASKDWPDEDVYWLYNYGIDSTAGMKPGKPIMLSFYTWDEYFETWWFDTAKRVSQALNTNPPVKLAITPNYSQAGQAMVLSYYNLYRSRYVGRYMQEAGIRVMPDLQFRADKEFGKHVKASLPNDLKWAALQVHNIFSETKLKNLDRDTEVKRWETETKMTFDLVRPENLLVYANDASWLRFLEYMDKIGVTDIKFRFQPTRMVLLSEKAKEREKKTGLN